jgi:hypothetical protein
MVVLGGKNEELGGASKDVFSLDINDGKITYLPTLNKVIWTTIPVYFDNGMLYMFFTGEENEGVPNFISYPLLLPL